MGLTDYKISLPQTYITPFGRGVVGDSLLQNLPGDPKVNILLYVPINYLP